MVVRFKVFIIIFICLLVSFQTLLHAQMLIDPYQNMNQIRMFLLSVFIFLIGFLIMVITVVSLRRKKKYRESLANYEALQSHKNLSLEQIHLCDKLVKYYRLKRPDQFLKNPVLYNLTVGNYIRDIVKKQNIVKRKESYAGLHDLRISLGFHKASIQSRTITSKEIPINTSVKVHINRKNYSALVTNNKEDFLTVKFSKQFFKIFRKGQRVQVKFYREGQGHYHYLTYIESLNPATLECLLEHNNYLRPPKKRSDQRISIHQECTLYEIPPSFKEQGGLVKAKRHQGLLINISNGGAKLVSQQDLAAKHRLTLDSHLFNRFQLRKVYFKIVIKSQQGHHNYYTYSIRFTNLNEYQHKTITNAISFYKKYKHLIKISEDKKLSFKN